MHPEFFNLLRRLEWPHKRGAGSLRWDRTVEPNLSWARGKTSVHAEVKWNTHQVQVTVTHKNPDGSLTPVLEAEWDISAGQAPALVRFEQQGQVQALCTQTALNRFRGQTLLMNVAPRWRARIHGQ